MLTRERALYVTGIGPPSLLKLRSLQNESHNVILDYFSYLTLAKEEKSLLTRVLKM